MNCGASMKCLTFLLLCQLYRTSLSIDPRDYLITYGYLKNETVENSTDVSAVTDISEALRAYQQFYRLKDMNGLPNEETLKMMSRPRCGVQDSPESFTLAGGRWTKRTLIWSINYFPYDYASREIYVIAQNAFKHWSDVTNLKFISSFAPKNKPDIMISFGGGQHYNNNKCKKTPPLCKFNFDGRGLVLGHAFPSTDYNDDCLEIHLDRDEDWYLGTDEKIPKDGKVSLLWILAHEIGHTLGLSHSDDTNSLMYSYYGDVSTLSNDDVKAIQHLYGKKSDSSTTTTTTTTHKTTAATSPKTITSTKSRTTISTITPSSPAHKSQPENYQDICKVDPKDLQFLVLHHNLYIINKDRLWIMELETKNFTTKDLSIHSVLPFLPKFEKIAAVYQRPSEEIVIVIESEIYIINDKNFQLIRKATASEIIATPFNGRKIIGAVNSYAGKTIYFFEDNYYMKINECNFGVESFGYISKDFMGIPASMDSVFRYINGMLYFFQNGRYFEYNEFTNSLHASDKIDLLKFDIQCPSLTLYEQLKELLTRILLTT